MASIFQDQIAYHVLLHVLHVKLLQLLVYPVLLEKYSQGLHAPAHLLVILVKLLLQHVLHV